MFFDRVHGPHLLVQAIKGALLAMSIPCMSLPSLSYTSVASGLKARPGFGTKSSKAPIPK